MSKRIIIPLTLLSNLCWGTEPPRPPASGDKPAQGRRPTTKPAAEPASKPARKEFKLPGLVINFQQRCVDLEGAVCLRQGLLELIACTKGTKEHESIVVIKARPMHIHVALLLLGAKNGNPAMRKPTNEKGTRWIDIPPKGDPVGVYLVFKGKTGKMVERPISDFVAPAERKPDEKVGAKNGDATKDLKFSHTFLFAGSLLRRQGPGPRKYLSDLSGNVISVVTFGDELLCLPGVYGQGNDSLMWRVDPTDLPEIGTKVTLRLRPKCKPAAKAGKADPPRSVRAQERSNDAAAGQGCEAAGLRSQEKGTSKEEP
jgi:hypothetical protein